MTIPTYKSYRFINKDPMIDKLRTVLQGAFPGQKRGMKIQYSAASLASGVKEGTLRNWFEGETKRPQFATLCAVARGAGYDLALVKRGKEE